MSGRGWIGVDLDGTLARYESGQGVSFVGAPIPRMVERVKSWLADLREVRIVTARVSPEWDDQAYQTKIIKAWCLEHLGRELKVQCHKDGSMVELWDDRAVGVVANEGVRQDELSQAIGRLGPAGYDRVHGEQWDPYAGFEPEQRYENGGLPGAESAKTIGVYGSSVADSGAYSRAAFYVTPREARCLAATLLRSANDAETPEES